MNNKQEHRQRPRVLVTGGSIAGPALAWGLRRAGFAATLLERAPEVRSAGQNVDIRGAGHDVLRRMGMHEAVAAAGTAQTQIGVLRARFAGVGWQTQRILDGFAARPQEFYFERAEQVYTPRRSCGRVAILGDSAWAGPTGMGTSLALLGAYVLAGELAVELANARREGSLFNPGNAFRVFETLLRPHVEKTQQLPPGVPAIALPKTRWGLRVLHGVHRLAATPALRVIAERALLPATSALELPHYPQLSRHNDDRADVATGVA